MKQLRFIIVGTFIYSAGLFFLSFLSLYLTQERGLSKDTSGILMASLGVGGIASTLIGGWFADRYGRRRALLLGLLATSIAVASFSLRPWVWIIPILITLYSAGVGIFRPAVSTMIADIASEEDRIPTYSMRYVAFNAGFMIAAPLGGWLVTFGYNYLFLVNAIATFAFFLITFFFLAETKKPDSSQNPTRRVSYKEVVRDKGFLLYVLLVSFVSTIFMQAIFALPIYMKEECGLTEMQYGLTLSINGLVIILLGYPAGKILRRVKNMVNMGIGVLIVGTSLSLMGTTHSLLVLMLLMALATVGEVLHAVSVEANAIERAPEHLRGLYMGVLYCFLPTGMMLSSFSAGIIMEHLGFSALFGFVFALSIITSAGFLLLGRRWKKNQSVNV